MSMLRPLRVMLMSGSMELGGSEQQTCMLLNHLDRTRFQPHLYLTYRRGELLDRIPHDVPIESFDDLKFAPAVNWPGRWHGRMVRHLRQLLERWQIEVVYDRTFHMTLIAGPACGRRVGRVSTIVCPPNEDLPSVEHRFLTWKKRRLITAYRNANQVIAVSETVKQAAVDYYGLSSNQIITLRSPVDVKGLRTASKLAPPSWFAPAAADGQSLPTNAICVGRMTREKGHDVLLQTAKILQERRRHQQNPNESGSESGFIFWLVGDGPLRSRLEQMAAELGVENDVRFVGTVAAVAPFMARCDALVCPSRYEGLPNVILEAMAVGLPVIASNVGGIPEVVQPQRTGTLVPADDPLRLADELWALHNNPEPFRTMASQGMGLIEQSFAISAHLQALGGYLNCAAGVT